MGGRRWTNDELELLRQQYGKKPNKRIAAALGRSVTSVRKEAESLGLRINRSANWWRGELEQFVRRGVAAGKLDSWISREWNAAHPGNRIQRRFVAYVRTRLELPRDKQLVTLHGVRVAAAKKQLETLNAKSFAHINERHMRRLAIGRGWPIGCSKTECDILDMLLERGQMTRREMGELLGRGDKPQKTVMPRASKSGDLLGRLQRKGLVSRSKGRPFRGTGRGRSAAVYRLSQKARDHRARAGRRSLLVG